MDSQLAMIKLAIDRDQHSRARKLLKTYMDENPPSADAYYLASELAQEDKQRRVYLDRALTLDPFQPLAESALDSLEKGTPFKWEIVRESALSNTPAQVRPSTQPSVPTMREVIEQEERAATKKDMQPYALRRYDLAGVPERLLALLIDGVVVSLITAVLAFLIGLLYGLLTVGSDLTVETVTSQASVLGSITGLLVTLWYPMRYLPAGGQTPGKKLMGIAVLKLDGSQVNAAEALLRNILGYALSSFFLLGFMWAFGDEKRQTWHDKIARTVVVRL